MLDNGSVSLEAFRAEHFNTWNTGLVLDVYRDLDDERYLNLRYQTSPQHDFLARHDVLMEIYQSLGSGWEASLGLRRMNFDSTDVDITKAGLAKYWGQWYARWVIRDIENNASSGIFNALNIRRYLNGNAHFLELRAGTGEEVVEVSRSNPAGTLDNETLGLRWQYYFDKQNGMNLDGNYVAPDGEPIRRSVTIEYSRRW